MNRTLALVILASLLVGCSRYGTRQNGPFANAPGGNPFAKKSTGSIPPGPAANNSPLALGTNTLPEAQSANQNVIPPRPRGVGPDNSGELLQTGAGVLPPDDGAALPPRRRKPEPQPDQLPSPFAPRQDSPATPAVPSTPAAPPTPAVDPAQTAFARNIGEIKKLVADATAKWDKVDCYEAVVTRRELPPKGKMCEDTVLYQFRKEPMSVYIKNLSESGKGRELLYSPAKHGDKIYAIVGQGDDTFLFKVGSKAPAVSPDFPMVKEKSRYSIREAGYGTPIARVAEWAAKAEAGKIPADAMTYHGPVTRPEFKQQVVGVQLKLRPGDDPLLPTGGMRQWFFDKNPDSPANGFPVLIVATEASGREVEYYLFEKLNFGVKLTDADFSPERLGYKR